MTTTTNDFVSALNHLIETCKDGAEGFRKAAENAQNLSLRQTFSEYAQQRAQFAGELQAEVSRIGGSPETSGSVSGTVHRGWIGLKSTLTGHSDHALLEEAERGEDVAVKAYRDALLKELPTELRAVIERQYRSVEHSHREIRTLRDETSDSSNPTNGTPVGTVL